MSTPDAGLSFAAEALSLVKSHIAWAEPVVFVLGFAESIAIVSLFIPSTALFLAIGALHAAAGGEFVTLWLAGACGAFIGDVVSFKFGRVVKRDLRRMWPLNRNPEWYVASRLFTRRRGMVSIIVSKFLGALRPFVPVVAGATGMRWPLFVVASLLSCAIWAGTFLSPGYGVKWLID